ncbi:MAG: HAD-IA family hydrolase [Deltaproteobacteria bacterium]|nr:HAD-IA family hydrolase [Deltaproteobacteria bacterium]
MIDAILWDLDGTLADTVDDIAHAIGLTLAAHGLPPLGAERVRPFIGDGAPRLVDRCVRAAGGEPTHAHLGTFRDAYRAYPRVTAALFPGIREVLEWVPVPQAVVTNKPEDVSRALLAALEIDHFFGAVVGGDTLPVRKPDAEPLRHALRQLGATRGLMVGDGPQDVAAARNAGLPVVGVDWGIHAPVGADARVTTCVALRAELAARLGPRYR